MAYSKKNYTGDGVTKLFTVTFPYIDPSHVTVTVNGTAVPYTFQSKYVIEFATAPGAGALIQLSRNSNPEARLVDFQDDSMGTEAMFNLNSDQLLFLAQEALDKTLEGSVIEQVQDIADAALASALSAASAAEAAQDAAESITYPIPVALGGTGSTTASEARTAMGLGTAATRVVGTSPGNVPEVETGGSLSQTVVPRLSGQTVKTLHVPITAWYAGTGIIPADNTVPQDTEGFLILSQAFTPTKSTNLLRVEYFVYSSNNTAGRHCVAALFRAGTPSALVSSLTWHPTANTLACQRGEWTVSAGSTAPVTFSLRVGADSTSSTYVNGVPAGGLLGSTFASYLRITEIEA